MPALTLTHTNTKHPDINKPPTEKPSTQPSSLLSNNTTAIIYDYTFNCLVCVVKNTGPLNQHKYRVITRFVGLVLPSDWSNMLTEHRVRPSPVLERDRGCCK